MFKPEIERTILDIDVSQVKKNLEANGCIFKGDNIQKYYVYNMKPFSSEIPALVLDLNNTHLSSNYKPYIKEKLVKKIIELFSVIDEESANELLEFFHAKDCRTLCSSLINDKYIKTIDILGLIEIFKKHTYNPNKWIRLRQTGNERTYTIKHKKSERENKLEYDIMPYLDKLIFKRMNGKQTLIMSPYTGEFEFGVNDIDKANFFLNQLGFFFKSHQEKRRISYKSKDGVFFGIDQWVLIPPYLEIEVKKGKKENLINVWLEKLCLDKNKAEILSPDDIHKRYGYNMDDYRIISFEQIEKY